MGYEWNGDPTILIVVIACSVCFGWVPIITVVSIVRNCRARLRAKRGSNGTAADLESHGGRPNSAPDIPKPLQTYNPTSTKGLERSASNRTRSSMDGYDLKRVDTNSSWDPIRHSFNYDNESLWGRDGLSRHSSRHRPVNVLSHVHHNTPSPSRPSSIRSVTSSQRQQIRSRRGSRASNYDNAPTAFQINDTYYDTTPLPKVTRPVNTAAVSTSRPTSSKGSGHAPTSQQPWERQQQQPQQQPKQEHQQQPQAGRRRGHSLDVPRDSDSLPRDVPRPSTSLIRRDIGEGQDFHSQIPRAIHRSHRPPRPSSSSSSSSSSAASRRADSRRPSHNESIDNDMNLSGALPPVSLPLRRGSLHAKTFERPAWLDEEPHAI
ncbi:hypothetical protein QBC36DRAFT_291167 [Triangularia setosa]|uniref:Uncharacterized protein n=1 Tax=Triangularia setosa TaxID=2587417 RepID=A0AAN7A561_9PEZI|nr:hypothetical protein QBC36DRAFT_291167 [Podospora setosa]